MATTAAVQEEAPATRFAKDQLKAIIERIERLEEEKKTISDDIRDVYAEGKGNGFDVKALRAIVRMRKQIRTSAPRPRRFWNYMQRWDAVRPPAALSARASLGERLYLGRLLGGGTER